MVFFLLVTYPSMCNIDQFLMVYFVAQASSLVAAPANYLMAVYLFFFVRLFVYLFIFSESE